MPGVAIPARARTYRSVPAAPLPTGVARSEREALRQSIVMNDFTAKASRIPASNRARNRRGYASSRTP